MNGYLTHPYTIKSGRLTAVQSTECAPFIPDATLVDAPAGVTQEEGHTSFLHLPSAVLALLFIAREGFSCPFPSLTVVSNLCTHELISSPLVGHFFFFLWGKIPVRVTAPRFELMSQRQKVEGFEVTN